ncbi:MAG TPA: hypothetical protein VGE20_00955 [Ramlibacter sp.]
MAPKERPESADGSDEQPEEHVTPVPDEDGPHDVPDEQVIERTMPAVPPRRSGGSEGSGPA